jgi:hypothetical protein
VNQLSTVLHSDTAVRIRTGQTHWDEHSPTAVMIINKIKGNSLIITGTRHLNLKLNFGFNLPTHHSGKILTHGLKL